MLIPLEQAVTVSASERRPGAHRPKSWRLPVRARVHFPAC